MDTFLDKLIEAGQFFAFVFAELVVLFIGISFLVGVLNEFITPDKAQRWLSASKGRGYFIGAGLGALTPFCSCSTIPIMLGLLKAKAGFGPTMTFLIASPLLNPVIIILFVAAIGLEKTLLYMIMAISMAIGAGLILEKLGYLKHVDPKAISGGGQAACCDKETSPASAPVQLQPAPFAMASVEAAPLSLAEATACCGSSGSGPIDLRQPQPNRWKRIFAESVGQFRTFLPVCAHRCGDRRYCSWVCPQRLGGEVGRAGQSACSARCGGHRSAFVHKGLHHDTHRHVAGGQGPFPRCHDGACHRRSRSVPAGACHIKAPVQDAAVDGLPGSYFQYGGGNWADFQSALLEPV